jgi:hypothetical protein
MNDNEMRELFGEMREEAVPGESLARVRMAVTERVAARRRMLGVRWKVAALLAVAGCLGLVMWQPWTVAPPMRVPMPAVAVEQSAPVEAPAPVVRKAVRAVAKPVRHVETAPVESGASEIRIESPLEPDVVIVLLGG